MAFGPCSKKISTGPSPGSTPMFWPCRKPNSRPHQLTPEMTDMEGYTACFSHATVKKGYSGVAAYSRLEPLKIRHGIGIPEFDAEGRIIEMTFDDFIFFNVYFPNGQMSEPACSTNWIFYDAFFAYANTLRDAGRSLVITGDFNTAHNEIDLKNPGPNAKRSGFLRIERDWLDQIIEMGMWTPFRHLYPETIKYSWWSYGSMPAKTTRDGGSIIFLSPGTSWRKAGSKTSLSKTIFSARITVL